MSQTVYNHQPEVIPNMKRTQKTTRMLCLFCVGVLGMLIAQLGQGAAHPARAQEPALSFLGAGLQGADVNNPTSLQFGPDGRLYVAQQDGRILALTIQRNGPADYEVIDTETIDLIREIPNHDDDGTLDTQKVQRQITGLYVAGTGARPVLYVTSSDWRIGGGSSGADKGLDTNSGVISRLTWESATGTWDKVDLVRGLARSEENHSLNGMALDEATRTLYVAAGGNTNAGSPSFKFAKITEYALAAAILKVDLAALEAMPVRGTGNHKYVYDLPTLDDPTRANANGITDPDAPGYDGIDVNDPFGGNDGLNQAKLVPGGPVQIFASGLRNAYDVVLTRAPGRAGRIYSIDNGANGGWGGHPDGEGADGNCTNDYVPGEPGSSDDGPNDDKVNNLDSLHLLHEGGYYGHPNPVRGNPNGAGLLTDDDGASVWRSAVTGDPATTLPPDWPPVPASLANPVECDFRNPGVDSGSLFEWDSSTNGLAEYTASNFDGALQGNLLTASFDGSIYRIVLNEAGDAVLNDDEEFASSFGATPLDVTAQGDSDPFPGTVWAATYGGDAITLFEPEDYDGSSTNPCTGDDNAAVDEDGDGYTNADELDNGTNPCSAASKPSDNDRDRISDRNDPDDDNDGLLDAEDRFAIDPNNGLTTGLPIHYTLLNNDPGTGFFGLGFTGVMADGSSDYLDLFDADNLVAGGAVGLFTISETGAGDAHGALNTQRDAFQFGVRVSRTTGPFLVRAVALGAPFFQPATPTGAMSQGVYIGTGDQSDYLKIIVNGAGIGVLYESDDTVVHEETHPVADVVSKADVDLYLAVDPAAGTVQPMYAVEGGDVQHAGEAITLLPQSPLRSAVQSENVALAVGLIATSRGGSPFNATWDHVDVYPDPAGSWTLVETADGSAPIARHEATFVEVNGKFYLIGGRGKKVVSIYDPATNVWVDGQNEPPMQLHHFQAVAWNGKIYILNAFTDSYPDETLVEHVYIYDPATDQWSQGPEIPADRRRASSGTVLYDDKIYVVAGIQNAHKSGHVAWFDAFDPATGAWTPLPDAPRARDHFSAVVIGEKLYAAGGRNTGLNGSLFDHTIPQVDVYDFAAGEWSTLPNPLPTERAAASTVALGSDLLVIGGESGAQQSAHDEVEALNVQTGEWSALDALNVGRHGTGAIVYDGAVWTAAGAGNKGSKPELDSLEVFHRAPVTAPELVAKPASLHFFSQDLHTTSAAQSVTLENVGSSAITLSGATLAGGDADSFAHELAVPVTLGAGETAKLSVTFAPTTSGLKAATLGVSHSGKGSPLAIPLTGEATGADIVDGILYRVNAGGPQMAAQSGTAASGPAWEADTDGQPSPYRSGGTANDTLDAVAPNASVPAETPVGIFATSRYDPGSAGDPLADEMGWHFPVEPGTPLEVRLYFAETYLNSGNNDSEGPRVFDVAIDGVVPPVFESIDAFTTAGHDVGFMLAHRTTSDGTLDLDFLHRQQNPFLSAIEILDVTPNTAPTVVNPIEDVTVFVNSASTVIDLSGVFDDAEDGASGLRFRVGANSNAGLVDAAVSGSTLTLTYAAESTGSADITVRATDSRGMSVSDSFRATVRPNTLPVAGTPPDGLTVKADGTPTTLDLTTLFSDAEEAAADLRYALIGNSDPGAVSARIDGVTLVLSQPERVANAAADTSGRDAAPAVNISVRATDAGGLSAELTLTVSVEVTGEANTAPLVLQPLADVSVDINSAPLTLALDDVFDDAEDSALSLRVVHNTNSAVVSPALDGTTLTLTFAPNSSGQSDITIRATDSGGLWIEDSFRTTVVDNASDNQPPTLDQVSYPSVNEGQTLTFTVSATDVDGDALTLSAPNAPAGATLADAGDGTGTFAWATELGTTGVYSITVVAADEHGAVDSRTIRATVNPAGTPVFHAFHRQHWLRTGEPFSLMLRASDENGDAIAFSADGLPEGATLTELGNGAARLDWTPGAADAGTHSFVLTATDTGGAAADELVTLFVEGTSALNPIAYLPLINFVADAREPVDGSTVLPIAYLPLVYR